MDGARRGDWVNNWNGGYSRWDEHWRYNRRSRWIDVTSAIVTGVCIDPRDVIREAVVFIHTCLVTIALFAMKPIGARASTASGCVC